MKLCERRVGMGAALLAMVLSAGACDNSSPVAPAAIGSVRIQTSLLQYPAGTPILVTVSNSGPATINFNECPTFLERHTGSKWVAVNPDGWFEDGGCEALRRILIVGASYSYTVPVPLGAPAGTYRLQLTKFWDDDGISGGQELPAAGLISNTFVIQ